MAFTFDFVILLAVIFIAVAVGAAVGAIIAVNGFECKRLKGQVKDLQQRIVKIKTEANTEHFTRLSEKEELLQHLTLATNSIAKGTAIHRRCAEIIYKYGGVAYGRSVASEESLENNS